MMLINLFAVLLCWVCQASAAELRVDVPSVIRNDVPVPIELHLEGKDVTGDVTAVRTVLFVPGKRRPKFYANLTHNAFESDPELRLVFTEPTYSLPVRKYLLGYQVELSDGEASVVVDSELKEVDIKDNEVNPIKLGVSITVVVAVIYLTKLLIEYVSPPGYLEASLPSYLHFLLSNKRKN